MGEGGGVCLLFFVVLLAWWLASERVGVRNNLAVLAFISCLFLSFLVGFLARDVAGGCLYKPRRRRSGGNESESESEEGCIYSTYLSCLSIDSAAGIMGHHSLRRSHRNYSRYGGLQSFG